MNDANPARQRSRYSRPGNDSRTSSASSPGAGGSAGRLHPPHLLRKHPLSFTQLLLLFSCVVFPAFATAKAARIFDYRLLLTYAVLVSIFSYLSCASDKRKAQEGEWRTPESTLHFLELIGGWPGSFIAQRRFRHKISKASYQITFWLIILLHQGVSLDYLNKWKYSLKAVSSLPHKTTGTVPQPLGPNR